MTVINKYINEIVPYSNNPRDNSAAVPLVAASIKDFGFNVPIIIDAEDVIICGHTRWLAAKSLGLETVPCLVADDLTDEQIRAFRIVDNKANEAAVWDFDKLYAELDCLKEIDMTRFGFEERQDRTPEELADSEYTGMELKTEELDLDDFLNEQYNHTCEECGFQWN